MQKLKLDELNRLSVSEFKDSTKTALTVVLDNVRSLHNVGSVFRTCDAFAVEQLYLCGITGQPPHREIEKTALGATESVHWKHEADVVAAIRELKAAGYTILAIEQVSNSVSLVDFKPEATKPYAIVFGNEVNGVSETILPLCDACIEIPQFGTKHSFNVSVTAGIVLWDFFMKSGV